MASRHIVRPNGGSVNSGRAGLSGPGHGRLFSPLRHPRRPGRFVRRSRLVRRRAISRNGSPTSPPTTSRGAPFSATGLGLAASYIEQHLRDWGVKPAGDHGSYLQTVRVLGVKADQPFDGHRRRSAASAGRSTTATPSAFRATPAAEQTVTLDRVEFAGYGLDAPRAGHDELSRPGCQRRRRRVARRRRPGRVRGARRIRSGREPPAAQRPRPVRDRGTARGREHRRRTGRRAGRGAADQAGAAPATGRGRSPIPLPTSRRPSGSTACVPPHVTGNDAFFEFLFSRAPVKYDELKRKADAREPLPSFRLDGVTLTFNVDADYEVVRTQLTQNVVGDRRGHRPAAEARPTWRSARTTITSATRKASSTNTATARAARRARPHHAGRRRRSHLERRRR